jgi:AP-2 complex subunit beta-1
MSYITLPNIVRALKDPLRQSLQDADPYVRKTAAICVAKLYQYDPHMVINEGFYELLRGLMADSNATVLANAVAALTEINERSEEATFNLNLPSASKLVAAMSECSEYASLPT